MVPIYLYIILPQKITNTLQVSATNFLYFHFHIYTIKKYINYTTPISGFNKDVIEKIIINSKLSFDERRIQSGEASVCECFHVDLIQTI